MVKLVQVCMAGGEDTNEQSHFLSCRHVSEVFNITVTLNKLVDFLVLLFL